MYQNRSRNQDSGKVSKPLFRGMRLVFLPKKSENPIPFKI